MKVLMISDDDLGNPLVTILSYAFERIFASRPLSHVPKILTVCAKSKIGSLVIESVTVNVVNFLKRAKDLLHSDRSVLSPGPNCGLGVPRGTSFGSLCVPLVLTNGFVVGIIHERDFTLGEFYSFHEPIEPRHRN
jgi:hypothetical protein